MPHPPLPDASAKPPPSAFRNPDGSVAVVVMNQTDKLQVFQLWMNGQAAKTASPAHSVLTLVVP